MRIGMSLFSFRPGRVGGAETYVRQLLAHLPRVAERDELFLLVDRDVARGLPVPGWERVVAPLGARALVLQRVLEAYSPWRARMLEELVAGIRLDVLFFPQQSVFPLHVEAPAVVTVGDVQHLYMPENFGAFDRTFRARAYPRSLALARHVIAVSQFTRQTLIERCGVPPDKVTAVPHGSDLARSDERGIIDPTALVSEPYLYYPAATFPHKDHETLLRSYATLRKRGELKAKLVFTGERTRLWQRRLLPLARRLAIERDVVHLGFVSDAEVRVLYARASAVVFPSRFEGLGIPVLEAARLGKRVVTSRLQVFDELGVPRRLQIDFADPESLLAALRDPGPASLEREPLTWRECAERTLEILKSAAVSHPPHTGTERPPGDPAAARAGI